MAIARSQRPLGTKETSFKSEPLMRGSLISTGILEFRNDNFSFRNHRRAIAPQKRYEFLKLIKLF